MLAQAVRAWRRRAIDGSGSGSLLRPRLPGLHVVAAGLAVLSGLGLGLLPALGEAPLGEEDQGHCREKEDHQAC